MSGPGLEHVRLQPVCLTCRQPRRPQEALRVCACTCRQRSKAKLILTVQSSRCVTVPERETRVQVDGAVLCFWPPVRCTHCRQLKAQAIVHEACYELQNRDNLLIASHLSTIYPTSRAQQEKQAFSHLRQALYDPRITYELREMEFLSFPAELQEAILSQAWPCPLLAAVISHWARIEVLSVAKRTPHPRTHAWDLRIPSIIELTLVMGVEYILDIRRAENHEGGGVTVPYDASRIVVAYNEYGVRSVQWANKGETVKTIPGALWYKTLRNRGELSLKHKVRE